MTKIAQNLQRKLRFQIICRNKQIILEFSKKLFLIRNKLVGLLLPLRKKKKNQVIPNRSQHKIQPKN